ncbi:MATE family efflux transporter [Ornithinimicrobium tianjinense]|uniref:MATE family efflux transporter n=1 Tax=Ornithinimicrobium tianjinense TaxID=1195761 RepID=A0A917BQU9_9MICO|nr:MATE family efflux transporter [Ornithinimicrobium tianjinense]GGF52616.1 MATE family efflux transporter [Ornithinimicrobium tianjinense]
MRREVLRLAVPAFLALVAEPLFLLADSAIVGFLGTTSLAGLGVASAVLLTAVNIFVFLAYGTTAVVARRLGAGDQAGALSAGVDGLWLSLVLGFLAAVGVALWAHPLVEVFGATPGATTEAVTYLRVSTLGIPPMLVVLAATGVLRGLQDTRTPLVAAVVGFTANAALSLLLVHGVGLGIAGAAWGTVIAQSGMAIALVLVVLGGARGLGASLRFHAAGVLRAALGGVPLLVRTLSLRAVLLLTTWVAAGLGVAELAAHQVAMTVWSALAFALDALAIAAQALTGRSLGAGDVAGTRAVTWMMVRWGVWFGLALGALIVALHRVLPYGFTTDAEVRAALAAALLVVAVGQPVSGVAFVLDGVLIGAGDARWLAVAQTLFLLAYLPMVLGVWSSGVVGVAGLVWLWVAFTGFMAVRAAGLLWRARGDAWLVTGAGR